LFSELIVSGYPRIDQALPVFVAFWRQRNVNRSARFRFPLRHKPFVNHCLDGSVHDSSVETEKCGDLILIERGSAPQCGQDKATSRRAPSFSLKSLPNGKIGCGNMGKH
jgi:hypothetical protein